MTRRLPAIATWLLLGDAVAAGLFWVLLQVPESSSLMLAASALVIVAIAVVLLWVQGGALAAWRPERTPAAAFRRGLGQAGAVIGGCLVFWAVWWLTAVAARWHGNHAGQIDAWIIARSGHSETAVLHRIIVGVIWFLRWGLGVTLAGSLAAMLTAYGVSAIGRLGWLSRALNPIRWVPVTLLVGVAMMLPWEYVYWRPAKLGLGAEAWFVAGKLGLMLVLWAVAAALIVRVVTPISAPTRSPSSASTPPPPATPPRAAA